MLATAERHHPEGALGVVEIIWHRPADPEACDGDCDYHLLVCGDPGISVPGQVSVDVRKETADEPRATGEGNPTATLGLLARLSQASNSKQTGHSGAPAGASRCAVYPQRQPSYVPSETCR